MRGKQQSGQVLVIVAVWMLALIGSAALILLAGSVEWQRNQLQQLADQTALDSALKIGVGCNGASARAVITEADNFIAGQRARTGVLNVGPGACAAGYTGTDAFAGGLSATIRYPYRAHQQQVEVILTVSLPISFGSYMGASNTTVTRRAVALQLNGSTAAVSATNLSCTGGQFNVAGSIAAQNAIGLAGNCAMFAHARFDAASGTYSDLGNVSVYANGQTWVRPGGRCVAAANAGSRRAICADGFELSGHNLMTCGTPATSAFLSLGDRAINPNPCAAGRGPQPVPPVSTLLPPDPNTDPALIAKFPGFMPCVAGTAYPNLVVGGVPVGTARVGTPVPVKDGSNFYHFKPSCYGYIDIAALPPGLGGPVAGAVLDPGFYYFNGSGFPGGGGICLNGRTLLARDVTLEFVNRPGFRPGFSTGTCAAGGGAGCAAANCQFGSVPCSIAACPPNRPADPASGGYTWFAAPCSQAPPGDASCPGSAWCPKGDRSCWNVVIWAARTNTGQMAIKGPAARGWLLGSVFWPGQCTYTVNGNSTIDGTISCGTLAVSPSAGAGIAVGSDYGISTALVEAVLLE